MTRYGHNSNWGQHAAWVVGTNGSLDIWGVHYTITVRPVFYLTSEIGLVGEGTITNPFIITSKN